MSAPPGAGGDEAPGGRDRRPSAALRATSAVLLVGAGIALGAVAWSVVGVARNDRVGLERASGVVATRAPSPTAVLVTQAVVLRTLRGASELTSAVFTMEVVVDESQERRLGAFPIGRTQLLYIAHGQVRAGVDLDRIAAADVTVAPDGVIVRLPSARILDAKIDVDRSYTYDVRRSLLGPAAPLLQSRAERFALERIVAGACADGVLQEANDRAELAVARLLAAMQVGDVQVATRPVDPSACSAPGASARGADATTPGSAMPEPAETP